MFTTSDNNLDRAHARRLERELVHQAQKAGRSKLANGTAPPEPLPSEAERADSRAFLREIPQALPIMRPHAFEKPRPVARPQAPVVGAPVPSIAASASASGSAGDVVVVIPAHRRLSDDADFGGDP